MRNKVIKHLRATFATLFDNETDQRRVVTDVGIATGNIHFNQAASNAWHTILEEADRQSKMNALLHYCITKEYPTNPALIFCRLLWIVFQLKWELEMLRALYTYSIANYTKESTSPQSFEDIIDVLENLWQPSREPPTRNITPVVEFIIHLHSKIDNPVAQLLRDWLESSIANLGDQIDQKRVAQIYQPLVKSKRYHRSIYLTIVLAPSKNGHKRAEDRSYILKAYLWEDNRAICKELPNIALTPEKIQDTVDKILDEIIGNNLDSTSLKIEFFLPKELLLFGGKKWRMPDQWFIPVEGVKLTYGMKYCIVFRSYERAERPGLFRIPWNEKWSNFPLADPILLAHCFSWVSDSSDYTPTDIHNELVREKHRIGVGFTSLPLNKKSRSDLYHALLLAGVPVMIWSRLPTDALTIDRLQSLMTNDACWHSLPECLQQARLAPDKNLQNLSHQLALLWDDPTRVPPHFPMVNP